MTVDLHKATPVVLLNDTPAADALGFGYDTYARTIAGMIANKENATPFSIGIHGSWGSGKTTLMRAIRTLLDASGPKVSENHRYCKTVWFNAWKYNQQAEILSALIETIFKAMAADGFFGLAKSQIEEIVRRIDQSRIFGALSKLTAGMDVSEFFSELEHKEKLGYSDTFQKFFDD